MKQLLKKIFIFGTMGIAVAIVATQVYAAPFVPTNNSNPEPLKFLDVSSTNQSKQGWFALGSPSTYNPLAVLDVKNTTFTDALSVLGKAWFAGNVLVGYTSIPSTITNKLMVDQGLIRSTNLAGTGDRPACSDANGKFIACSNNASMGTPQIVSTSPLCGAAANTFATTAPTQLGDLCDISTQQNAMPLGPVSAGANGTFTWTCYNWQVSGFVSATCSTSPLPPTCGGSAHIATQSAPSTDLCLAGNPSSVSGGTNGVYTWSCTDTYGNTPASCSTPANNVIPTQPTGCFAMRGINQGGVYPAVFTCAQGSANATRYEIQNLSDNGTTWVNNSYDSNGMLQQISSVPSVDTKPMASGLGTWTRSLSQILPQSIIISEWKDPQGNANVFYAGDYSSSILWRIRGCSLAGCGPYSDPIAPFNFYNPGADNIHGYYDGSGSNYTFHVTKTLDSGTNTLTFTWPKLPNATLQAIYPTVYIYQCSQSGCMGPLFPGAPHPIEYVDPLTLNSTQLAHGSITCTSGTNATCSTTLTSNIYPLNADYMVTLGKDLYNDGRPGPTQSAINGSLSGYFSAWDQFSPWTVAGLP